MRIIRTLLPAEVRCYRDHLCRLDPESRRSRFGTAMSDFGVDAYMAGFVDGRHRVIGAFSDAVTVIGAVEVSPVGNGDAELAFSVEAPARRRGLGRALFERAVIAARNRRFQRLVLTVQADNLPMRRLAARAGCTFTLFDGMAESVIDLLPPTPDSILREARAEQAGAAAWAISVAWWIATSKHRPAPGSPAVTVTAPIPTPVLSPPPRPA